MGVLGQGFASTGFGIASSPAGVEYLADYGGHAIDRFNNETGEYMGQLGTGFLVGPTFIAVAPEPLPAIVLAASTLALLVRRRNSISRILQDETIS